MRLLKKIALSGIVVLSILFITAFLIFGLISRQISNWGNYSNFCSDVPFDSISMKVCDFNTTFFADQKDSTFLCTFGDAFRVPEKGFPCPVEFDIFQNGNLIKTIRAPDFNCNNCDVNSHNYEYSKGKITYSISH